MQLNPQLTATRCSDVLELLTEPNRMGSHRQKLQAQPADLWEEIVRLRNAMDEQLTTGAPVVVGNVPLDTTACDPLYLVNRSTKKKASTAALPLTEDSFLDMYYSCDSSYYGLVGSGNVYDIGIRRSREATCAQEEENAAAMASKRQPTNAPKTEIVAVLPTPLQRFDFPGAREQIRKALCPQATEVDIVPYKMVLYDSADLFQAHVDAVGEGTHVGTVSLLIPAEEQLHASDDAQGSVRDELMRHSHVAGDRAVSMTSVRHGGSLRLYTAGGSSPFNTFGTRDPHIEHPELTDWVDVNDHSQIRNVNLADQCSAAVVHMRCKQGKSEKDVLESFPLAFAAWHTDTLHEVVEMPSVANGCFEKGPRCVVTYEVHIAGSLHVGSHFDWVDRPLYSIIQRIGRLAQTLLSNRVVATDGETSDRTPHRSCPLALGVKLRHAYPAAALSPATLKGVDRELYEMFSDTFRCCRLVFVEEMRQGEFEQPQDTLWDATDGAEKRLVERKVAVNLRPYQTMAVDSELRAVPRNSTAADAEEADPCVPPTEPTRQFAELLPAPFNVTALAERRQLNHRVIQQLAWLDAGGGHCEAGGDVMGNWDCGTDWYYADAALIVTPLDAWGKPRRQRVAMWWMREAMPRLFAPDDLVGEVLAFC